MCIMSTTKNKSIHFVIMGGIVRICLQKGKKSRKNEDLSYNVRKIGKCLFCLKTRQKGNFLLSFCVVSNTTKLFIMHIKIVIFERKYTY